MIMGKVKWIKINTDMFEDEKLRLIDTQPDRDIIILIWIMLLVQAGRTNDNGLVYLNVNMPYTNEMLAAIYNRPVESIDIAIKYLKELKMIDIDKNNIIYITNWEKHQNIEGMEKVRSQTQKRVKKHRESKKNNIKQTCNVTVTQQRKRENLDKEEDIELEVDERQREIHPNKTNSNNYLSQDNNLKEIDTNCADLVKYFEFATESIGLINASALKVSIIDHGYENVKAAIDVSIEQNKPNITYINGILRNWKVEGYPATKNKANKLKKGSDINEFNNFTPKQSTTLSDEQRYNFEKKLI